MQWLEVKGEGSLGIYACRPLFSKLVVSSYTAGVEGDIGFGKWGDRVKVWRVRIVSLVKSTLNSVGDLGSGCSAYQLAV